MKFSNTIKTVLKIYQKYVKNSVWFGTGPPRRMVFVQEKRKSGNKSTAFEHLLSQEDCQIDMLLSGLCNIYDPQNKKIVITGTLSAASAPKVLILARENELGY